MRTLRARILGVVGIVVASAVTIVGFYSSRVAKVEFLRVEALERVVPAIGDLDAAAIADQLDVRLESGEPLAQVIQSVQLEVGPDWSLVLFDADGRVLATTLTLPPGAEVDRSPRGAVRIKTDDGAAREVREIVGPTARLASGRTFALVQSSPSELSDAGVTRSKRFGETLDRALLLGSAAIGLIALLAAWVVVRGALRPIELLTRAAQRMAEGDLAHRVERAGPDEVGELAGAFNTLADSLERKEQQRRAAISDVAHELRTPLTAIRCELEAARDGLTRTDRRLVDSLHEEALLLGRLVDDLRDLSLGASGQLELRVGPVDVALEIDRAVAATRGPAKTRPEIVIDVEGRPALSADAGRLQQILRNLLENAVAHAGTPGRVTVAARQNEDHVEISITDDGPGIAAEQLPQLFDRFYRTDPSRTRSTGGTGLGLAIVRQLTECHGGRVECQSEPGSGARFTVRLPSR